MIKYSNFIANIVELKNVKVIHRSLTINKDYKLLDIFIKNNKKKYNNNKYKSSQISLINYKNKQKSVILYEQPKTQLLQLIQPIQPPIQTPILPSIQLKKNHINKNDININDINYYRLSIISIAGFSTLSFCTYGYLVFNNLELICLI